MIIVNKNVDDAWWISKMVFNSNGTGNTEMGKTLSSLTDQLAAARAAYAASPTAANKAIAVDLVRHVAAAKKAAEPKVDLEALAQQAKAAQVNREQASKADAAIDRAKRLYEEAHEYPRCGQSWPFGAKEEAAMAILIKAAARGY